MSSEIVIVLGKKANNYKEISKEGMERVKGLFLYLAKNQDLKYIIFSGADTNNSGISEAKAMYKFFVEHCNEKIIAHNPIEVRKLIFDGVISEAYSIKSNQLFSGRKLEVYLEEKGTGTYENNSNSQKICSNLEDLLQISLKPRFISHKYHLDRLRKRLGKSVNYEPIDKYIHEDYIKPELIEHIFKFLTSIGCDNPKIKRPIYNFFNNLFGR